MKTFVLIIMMFLSACSTSVHKPSYTVENTVNSDDILFNYLNQSLDSFIFSNSLLPSIEDQEVLWTVLAGDAYIDNNVLYKNQSAKEYEPLTLQAKVDNKSYAFDNILLLDERAAYLMSYFGGSGEDYENPKLAYTYNGMMWYILNNDQPIFYAESGTKRIRDPYILRKKDGSFSMISTQGWNNPSIYAWDSQDCTSFNNERLLKVNSTSNELKMSETQAWAPEAFYDRIKDSYIIYWSSPNDGGMYYNMSKDLIDFSYPKKLLDLGFKVIDGTIIKNGYDYSIILKDERTPMEEHSRLFLATSDTDYLGFNKYHDNFFTGHQSEGPFVMKGDYDYILYYDDYTRFKFLAKRFSNIRYQDFYDENMMDEVIAPMDKPRHASVIPITMKELKRIASKFEQQT